MDADLAVTSKEVALADAQADCYGMPWPFYIMLPHFANLHMSYYFLGHPVLISFDESYFVMLMMMI